MRLPTLLPFFLALGFAAPACTDAEPEVNEYIHAMTGAACVPDATTYMDLRLRTRTTTLDCVGETTDIDHPDYCCRFPQPGCDAQGCCDSDIVEPIGPDID